MVCHAAPPKLSRHHRTARERKFAQTGGEKVAREERHVTKNGEGRWDVIAPGATRASSSHDTRLKQSVVRARLFDERAAARS